MPCTGCGVGLRSDPPLGMHSLSLVCMQILLLLATLPVFWAIAKGGWIWAGMIWLVLQVLGWFLGAVRHARSPIVRAVRDPNRSYARRPNA